MAKRKKNAEEEGEEDEKYEQEEVVEKEEEQERNRDGAVTIKVPTGSTYIEECLRVARERRGGGEEREMSVRNYCPPD